MSSFHLISKTHHTYFSWSSSTCGNVTMWGSGVKHSRYLSLCVTTGLSLISAFCPESTRWCVFHLPTYSKTGNVLVWQIHGA
jgi:hypothetical protein